MFIDINSSLAQVGSRLLIQMFTDSFCITYDFVSFIIFVSLMVLVCFVFVRAVNHPEYPSVLQALEIEDPVVANCLIDQKGIESILLIKVRTDNIYLLCMMLYSILLGLYQFVSVSLYQVSQFSHITIKQHFQKLWCINMRLIFYFLWLCRIVQMLEE